MYKYFTLAERNVAWEEFIRTGHEVYCATEVDRKGKKFWILHIRRVA